MKIINNSRFDFTIARIDTVNDYIQWLALPHNIPSKSETEYFYLKYTNLEINNVLEGVYGELTYNFAGENDIIFACENSNLAKSIEVLALIGSPNYNIVANYICNANEDDEWLLAECPITYEDLPRSLIAEIHIYDASTQFELKNDIRPTSDKDIITNPSLIVEDNIMYEGYIKYCDL